MLITAMLVLHGKLSVLAMGMHAYTRPGAGTPGALCCQTCCACRGRSVNAYWAQALDSKADSVTQPPLMSILVFTVPGSRQLTLGGGRIRSAISRVIIMTASLLRPYASCASKPFSCGQRTQEPSTTASSMTCQHARAW